MQAIRGQYRTARTHQVTERCLGSKGPCDSGGPGNDFGQPERHRACGDLRRESCDTACLVVDRVGIATIEGC